LGCSSVQFLVTPFHTQVSLNESSPLGELVPLNSRTVLVTGSYIMFDHTRAGGETGGNCWAQLVPSHVQVSPKAVPVPTGTVGEPPKTRRYQPPHQTTLQHLDAERARQRGTSRSKSRPTSTCRHRQNGRRRRQRVRWSGWPHHRRCWSSPARAEGTNIPLEPSLRFGL